MTPKEELKKLVDLIKAKAKNERRVLRNDDIANRLKLDPKYFATLIGTRGNVTDKHLSLFKSEFRDDLGNLGPMASSSKEVIQAANTRMLIEEVAKLKSQLQKITVDQASLEMKERTIAIIEGILEDQQKGLK